jgi:hypothetical protein
MNLTPQSSPVWLVQRLTHDPQRKELRPDYMGSAEFEFGTLRHTFGLLAQASLTTSTYWWGRFQFWIVGTSRGTSHAHDLINDQFSTRKWRLKERTYLPEIYLEQSDYHARINAWMGCVEKHYRQDQDRDWCLFGIFTSEQAAQDFNAKIQASRIG